MTEQEKFYKMLREWLTIFFDTWGVAIILFIAVIVWHWLI